MKRMHFISSVLKLGQQMNKNREMSQDKGLKIRYSIDTAIWFPVKE